jgi:hypothetical protein
MSQAEVEGSCCGHYTKDVGALDDTTFARLVSIQSYSDKDLKALAHQLAEEELEISRRRRVLHGEIDIVRAEMVRRLRDEHGAGGQIFGGDDISALTAILARHGNAEAQTAPAGAGVAPEREAEDADGQRLPTEQSPRAIQERFRDLSANVRSERLIRYISKQVGEGRSLDDVMADHYIMSHTNETTRATLVQNPAVLKAVDDAMKRLFAEFESSTRARPESQENKPE